MGGVARVTSEAWARVRALRLAALRDAPDAFWTTVAEEEATPPAAWGARLARADVATFVAARDGVDVGLVVGLPHHEVPGDAHLAALWVAPGARGAGAGDALVDAVVAWARAEGYRRLRLDVADDNAAAVRLYARLGFVPTGRTGALPPPREHVTEHERALDL